MSEYVFIDKVGRALAPGDLIIYGHALGRCASLQYGKVLEIVLPNPDAYCATGVRLRVQGVDADDSWLGRHLKRPWKSRVKLLKPGLLQFPSRVLWVNRNQVPPEVLQLLDQVQVD